MRLITKEIIIHCSATKKGKDIDAKDIELWHKKRGFKKIGYHFVVKLNGQIQVGRDINSIGAHCFGKNKTSIGICYVGGLDHLGKPKDTRTKEQKKSLLLLINQLKRIYSNLKVFGHNDFNKNKLCPCFEASLEYDV